MCTHFKYLILYYFKQFSNFICNKTPANAIFWHFFCSFLNFLKICNLPFHHIIFTSAQIYFASIWHVYVFDMLRFQNHIISILVFIIVDIFTGLGLVYNSILCRNSAHIVEDLCLYACNYSLYSWKYMTKNSLQTWAVNPKKFTIDMRARI